MLRVVLAGAVLFVAGCSSHGSDQLTRPTVSATGPIISATPRTGASSQTPSGAEGVSTFAVANCPLASAGQIAASLGGRIASQSTTTSGKNGQQCQISLANSNLGPGVTLFVSRNTPVSAATFTATKSAALKSGAQSVSGVGQDAYYAASAHTLQYRAGSVAGSLGVSSTNPAALTSLAGQVRADLIVLGKRVVANQ